MDAVTDEHGGDHTGLGAIRTCAVTMNGRKGTLVERCVEAVPESRASFLVVDDSFGFSGMFTGYGFTAHFTPTAGPRTVVRIETFYTPEAHCSSDGWVVCCRGLASAAQRSVEHAAKLGGTRRFRFVIVELLTLDRQQPPQVEHPQVAGGELGLAGIIEASRPPPHSSPQ